MNATIRYKGYTIRSVGLSHYIYRPGQAIPGDPENYAAPGYAQSMAAARRWVNADLQKKRADRVFAFAEGLSRRGLVDGPDLARLLFSPFVARRGGAR